MAAKGQARAPLGGLTALRFFAACYVLLFHTRGGTWFNAGYLGVTLFFVLSGFILAYNHPEVPAGQRKRFYISRFARIYPLFLFSYFVYGFGMHTLYGHGVAEAVKQSVLYLTLVHTWIPRYHWAICAGAWTLSCEMFFYAVFPFVVSRMERFVTNWKWAVALLWSASLGPSLLGLWWGHQHPESADTINSIGGLLTTPLFHLPEFLLGIVLGLQFLRNRPTFGPVAALVATAICVVSLGVAGRLPQGYGTLTLNGGMALPFGLLIYTIAGWNSKVLANPPLQLGGEISYSMYLLQGWIVEVVQDLLHHRRDFVALRFGLFLVVSYLTYRLIEKPARRWILRWCGIESHPKPIETTGRALP